MKVKLMSPTAISFPDGTAHMMGAGAIVDVPETQGHFFVETGHAKLAKSSDELTPMPDPMIRANMEVGSDAVGMVVDAMVRAINKPAQTPAQTPAHMAEKPVERDLSPMGGARPNLAPGVDENTLLTGVRPSPPPAPPPVKPAKPLV